MGLRGPAPTSKAELEQRGSWLAKTRDAELVSSGNVPEPPKSLQDEALAEWNRLAAILGPAGALSGDLDRAALYMLCKSWQEYLDMEAKANEMESGSMEWRMVVNAKNDAFKRWNDLAKRFGLTPADRPRVKLSKSGTQDKKGKGRFFSTPGIAGKIGA